MADTPAGTSGHEDSLEPGSGPPNARSRRACDACHERKIRCNKESPCAHCSRAGLVCTFTADQPRQKRTRILLTPQYEKKIDRMDRRLNDIVGMLGELKNNIPTQSNQSKETTHTPEGVTPSAGNPPGRSLKLTNTITSSKSDSTMAAHSVFAHDFIEKTVTTDPSISHNPDMRKVFDELKDTIRSFGPSGLPTETSYPHATPIQRPSLRGCQMPPIEKVVEVIRDPNCKLHHNIFPVQGAYPRFIEICPLEGERLDFIDAFPHSDQNITRALGLFYFFPVDNLADLSLGVYFAQECSEIDFVTVNVGLHYVFQAYSSRVIETERERYLQFADMCGNNIDTGLSNLPLYLPPTVGTVVALLCGIYYSLDISQPHLAWTLVTKASELCQTLGYHHIGHKSEDSKGEFNHKQRLFWFLYVMDKGLSLRLGRASTIQDWDVTIPLPESTPGDQASDKAPMPLLALGVKIARCQGNIQELLHSSTSLALPDQTRHSRVQILEHQLGEVGEEIRASIGPIEKLSMDAGIKDLSVLLLHSYEIAHLSLLTLVYRAAPRHAMSPIFSEQCMEKARATLERLHCFLELMQNETAHVPANAYNILLYSPIPFVVMFCNTIETLDRSDLIRLRDFNTLLTLAAPGSGPIAKMQRLFHALYNVALQYVEIRTTHGGAEQTRANAEMDSCLSMLGITMSDLVNQQQQGGDPGQLSSHAASDALEVGRHRRESMNPLVWMDNMLQPDDFNLW